MMTVVLLLLCIASSAFTGNIFCRLARESHAKSISIAMPSVWLLLLGMTFAVLAGACGDELLASGALIALLAGGCIAVAAVLLLESMKKNALSVSVILVNLNFVIPILCAALLLGERAAPLQLFGMTACVCGIVLLHWKRGEGVRGGVFLPLVACIANGLFNFCIKVNERADGSALWFFALAYLFGALLCVGGALLFRRSEAGDASLVRTVLTRRTLPAMLAIGVCNGVCFYTARLLAERMNAAAQFTLVTCTSILLSVTIGFLWQGDRFTKKSAMTLLLCLIAVLCQYTELL